MVSRIFQCPAALPSAAEVLRRDPNLNPWLRSWFWLKTICTQEIPRFRWSKQNPNIFGYPKLEQNTA
jgi:hypothetical protein